MNAKVLEITQPGATGPVAYDLAVNFDLKAIVVLGAGVVSNTGTTVANGLHTIGAGTFRGAAVQQWTRFFSWADAQAASQTVHGFSNAAIFRMHASGAVAAGIDCEITLTSFSLQGGSSSFDRFTLNWTNLFTTASVNVSVLALGGSDITDAVALPFTFTAATTHDITTLGFQPDLVFLCAGNAASGASSDTAGAIAHSMGWGIKDGAQYGHGSYSTDGTATNASEGRAYGQKIGYVMGARTGMAYILTLAASSGWNANGFQLTSNVAAAVQQCGFLALKGTFQSAIIETTSPTSVSGVKDVTVGFTAKAVWSRGWAGLLPTDAKDVAAAGGTLAGNSSEGFADGTTELVVGWAKDDSLDPSDANRVMIEDKGYAALNQAGAVHTNGSADVSFTGNDVRYTFPTFFATGHGMWLLALGDAAGAAAEIIPDLVMARS